MDLLKYLQNEKLTLRELRWRRTSPLPRWPNSTRFGFRSSSRMQASLSDYDARLAALSFVSEAVASLPPFSHRPLRLLSLRLPPSLLPLPLFH